MFLSLHRGGLKTVPVFMSLCLTLAIILSACSDESTSSSVGTTSTSSSVLAPPPTNDLLKIPTIPVRTGISGGTVSGAKIKEADTLHYYKTTNSTSFEYLSLLYAASLTRRNPLTLALDKNAAESWTSDSATSTVTFKLKASSKWSDGQPITADDYVWTYEQARKAENGWYYATGAFYQAAKSGSEGIESYTALDASTLVIKLHSATFDMVTRADVIEPLPKHIWEKLDWNNPAKNPEINKPSVVSGPWLLKEWKQGEYITLVRNPNSSLYPVPTLDSLTIKIVADSQVALQKLKNNELDFYSPETTSFASFENLSNVQSYRWTPGRATFHYVGFNFRKPYLQDIKLRQALAYATDRSGLLATTGAGLGRLQYSDVLPWHPFYQEPSQKFAYDSTKALDLLKVAGYNASGTKLVTPNGTDLSTLRLAFNAPSPVYSSFAQSLKQSYKQLGINLELQELDFSSFVKLLQNPNSNYDLFLGGWQTDYDPENFGEIWANVPELNNGAYRNDKLLDLYRMAQLEQDSGKRKALMAQIQQIESTDLPYIYLYAELGSIVINKRVGGIAQTYVGVSANLYTDWYLLNP
ncbi:MAG: ABC transporter substrate-binding protein [Chloroflexi bacterium]|uniref:ABC transporter substrate-binding protein n=2 Tax=Candidatus Chlorohelix allophototropha TaxID=3003348 RepID=A0A8T7LY56_9CHLR|nr:ABC transporter substrate-binding protein [Chloroflexota bacterium]